MIETLLIEQSKLLNLRVVGTVNAANQSHFSKYFKTFLGLKTFFGLVANGTTGKKPTSKSFLCYTN